jgi:hypothetical protein
MHGARLKFQRGVMWRGLWRLNTKEALQSLIGVMQGLAVMSL